MSWAFGGTARVVCGETSAWALTDLRNGGEEVSFFAAKGKPRAGFSEFAGLRWGSTDRASALREDFDG